MSSPNQTMMAAVLVRPRRFAEKMGATLAVPFGNSADLLETVLRATGPQLCNVVIEAGGVQETLDIASTLKGTGWRLVIAGYEREEAVHVEGIRLAAVASARIRLEGLVSHFFPLNEIENGFRTLEERPEGFVKGVVRLY